MDKNNMSIILPENQQYKIVNNLNIINQKGLFFYNNHPWYPLERTFVEYIQTVIKKIGREKFDEMRMIDRVSGCFNIHKSLIPEIRKRLNDKGITRSFIYPDLTNFGKVVTEKAILNSLTLSK
jgi:hypothetical protein